MYANSVRLDVNWHLERCGLAANVAVPHCSLLNLIVGFLWCIWGSCGMWPAIYQTSPMPNAPCHLHSHCVHCTWLDSDEVLVNLVRSFSAFWLIRRETFWQNLLRTHATDCSNPRLGLSEYYPGSVLCHCQYTRHVGFQMQNRWHPKWCFGVAAISRQCDVHCAVRRLDAAAAQLARICQRSAEAILMAVNCRNRSFWQLSIAATIAASINN